MTEDAPNPAASDPQPAAIPIYSLRFCRKCGIELQLGWAACENCIARVAARQSNDGVLTIAQERRSISNALFLYIALLLVSLGIGLSTAKNETPALSALTAHEILTTVIVSIWSAASINTLLPALRKTGSLKWIVSAPVIGAGTFIIAMLAISNLDKWLHMGQLEYLQIFERAGYGLGLATLMIAVYPAIFEELAFRGIIFDSLRRVTGGMEAVFVSAAMFAVLHLSVASFLHLFVLGAVLGWLRHRSGSLFPGMILHFTHNFLCLWREHTGGTFPW